MRTEEKLHQLKPEEYSQASSLLGHLEIHLAVKALLDGDSPGDIYLDDRDDPQSAFALTMNRCFLGGRSDDIGFNRALQGLLAEQIYPSALEQGKEGFTLFYEPGNWGEAIEEVLLKGKYPIKEQRLYYHCKQLEHNWRNFMPDGYTLLEVDKSLVESEGIGNLEALIEEMHSECRSVSAFFQDRFGYCVRYEDQLVAWCLSEYNSGGRCEVGIATRAEHRRRGLAKVTSLALVEKALEKGYQDVGWHCYAGNEASIASALAAGFEKVSQYPAYWALFAEAGNLGANGNQQFEREAYQEAVEWYLKAIDAEDTPVWVFWNTACAYAHQDQRQLAFQYLHQAIDQGFTDAVHMSESQHFEQWHETEEWQSLTRRLAE